MKNITYFFAILTGMILIGSCSKSSDNRALNAPAVTTGTATNLAGPTATLSGDVTDDGGSIVTAAGVCYDTVAGVTVSKNTAVSPHTVSGSYSINLSGLIMGKTYYYKAYATNSKGTTYGAEQSFFAPFSVNGYYHSSEVAASNLVAYWAFENSYIDSVSKTVGTANHPTAISFVTGLNNKGQAVEVASPGYINTNITNTIANLDSFTVACWIKQPANLSSGPTTYIPFSLNAAGYSWEQTKFFMLFNNADVNGKSYGKVCIMDHWFDQGQTWPAMLDGKWHHLIITFDGGTGALGVYVDGTLLPAATLSAQPNFGSADSFTLGGPDDNTNAGNGWMNSLSGDLDEFKVFNRGLTAAEVQALYLLQFNGL